MSNIKTYHVHFYFDENTVETAKAIYEESKVLKNVSLGRFHERPVGPHSMWSFMISFETTELAQIMPWITVNRKSLQVLVHPNTDNDLLDHTEHAVWFGEKVELNLERF